MKLDFLFTQRNESKQRKESVGTLNLAGSTVKIRCSVHIQQVKTTGDGHVLVSKTSLK